MLIPPKAEDEAGRLAALEASHALLTGPDPALDRLTALTARSLGMPIAFISLIGEETQWLKSCFNFEGELQTSRETAFCAHTILNAEPLVVEDTTLDSRFSDNAAVVGPPHIRFYSGAPLAMPSGHNIGTLCVADTVPRIATPETLGILQDLAKIVVDQIELRKWIIEEEARQRISAETNYRRLADAILGMVFRVRQNSSKDSVYEYLSPGSADLTGVPKEVLGHPGAFEKLVHPDDLEAFRASGREAWTEGKPWNWSGRIITPAGVTKWVQGESRFERQADGSAILEGLIYDISESKQREQALNEAKDAAEKANLEKSEFLSRMSHELRTPLNAILGFAQMLEMGTLGPEAHQDLSQIRKGGEHLLALINEVLDLASVDSKRITMSIEPIRYSDVIAETIAMLRPLFERRSVRLVPVSVNQEIFVLADRQRLKQIVINLVTNAVKYNRQGGSVSVKLVRDSDRVVFSVTDEGAGIAPENMDRLFKPFDRLGAEATGIEGSGLGLSISRGLCELMDGTLSVRSVLGEGSTFSLSLPATEAPNFETPLGELGATSTPKSSTQSVLYVEDNDSNIVLIERILGHRSEIRLTTARTLAAGLAHLAETQPDLILLDLNLPDGSGESIIKWVRSQPAYANLPIIVLSADATLRTRERVLLSGADHYLTKPLDIQGFLKTLDSSMPDSEPDPPS